MAIERSVVIFKPEVRMHDWDGKILSCLMKIDLKPVAGKLCKLSIEQLEQLYAVHLANPGRREMMVRYINYMMSGPVWVFVFEGEDAVNRIRELMGATMPDKAAPGTIRNAYGWVEQEPDGNIFPYNVIHGSDSPETAAIEAGLFFKDPEEYVG